MAVDQPKVIDIVSRDKDGNIVLTISDHLDWSDAQQHLEVLQDKINTYLTFVESGEIYEKFPAAKGRHAVIEVMFHYKPSPEAYPFLSQVKSIVETSGLGFRFDLFAATPFKI